MGAFACDFKSDFPPEDAGSRFLVEWGSAIAGLGYSPQTQTTFGATYTRRYSPVIYIVLYVILFPIGLLLLLARPRQSLTFTFEAENGATRIVASGTDNRVRRRLLSAGFAEGSG